MFKLLQEHGFDLGILKNIPKNGSTANIINFFLGNDIGIHNISEIMAATILHK